MHATLRAPVSLALFKACASKGWEDTPPYDIEARLGNNRMREEAQVCMPPVEIRQRTTELIFSEHLWWNLTYDIALQAQSSIQIQRLNSFCFNDLSQLRSIELRLAPQHKYKTQNRHINIDSLRPYVSKNGLPSL